jgi:hypothetical protein
MGQIATVIVNDSVQMPAALFRDGEPMNRFDGVGEESAQVATIAAIARQLLVTAKIGRRLRRVCGPLF